MSARLAITARASLGSGRLLLRCAVPRPVTGIPPSLVMTSPSRHVHQSPRLEPAQRPVHGQPKHHSRGNPRSAGRRVYRAVVAISALVGIAVTIAVVSGYIAGYQVRMASNTRPDASDLERSDANDELDRRHWINVQEYLKDLETRADEPYRTLYREAREAIAKRDIVAARRALSGAWEATKDMKECRLTVFPPHLVTPLYTIHAEPPHDSATPPDIPEAARLLEEVLPVLEEARAIPLASRPDDPNWRLLWLQSLPLRAALAEWHLLGQLGVPFDYVRAEATLKPGRDICIDLIEGRCEDGLSDEGILALSAGAQGGALGEIFKLSVKTALATHRISDALEYGRYRAKVALSQFGSDKAACSSINDVALTMLMHQQDGLKRATKEGTVKAFAGEGIRPEFGNYSDLMSMPLEKLLSANGKELLTGVAALTAIANQILHEKIPKGTDHHNLGRQHFLMAAKMMFALSNTTASFEMLKFAAQEAKAFAEQTGRDEGVKEVAKFRETVVEQLVNEGKLIVQSNTR